MGTKKGENAGGRGEGKQGENLSGLGWGGGGGVGGRGGSLASSSVKAEVSTAMDAGEDPLTLRGVFLCR